MSAYWVHTCLTKTWALFVFVYGFVYFGVFLFVHKVLEYYFYLYILKMVLPGVLTAEHF